MRRNLCLILCCGLLVVGLAGWLSLDAGEKGKAPEVLTSFKGHSELVYAVTFSQDGKYLATASFDNTVKLWEAATGKELKTFAGTQGHTKMVLCVALSNDGQMLASGSADNTLKIWDVPLNTPLRTAANNDTINAVALSPDGTKLASAGKDGLVKIWNAADFKELNKLEGHAGPVTGVAYNANGQVLVSCGADRTLRFWNLAGKDPQLIASVGAHSAGVNAVAFNPNNTAAYSVGDDGLLKFWQVPPVATKPLPAHTGNILAMTLSADGSQVVTGGADKTVRQSLTAGKDLKTLTGPTGDVLSVALHPQNTVIAAGSADSRLYLWNAADGKASVNPILGHAGSVTAVGFNPQGTQLVSAGADGLVKFWAVPFVPTRTMTHPDGVLAAVPFTDGKRIYTGGTDKTLRAWDSTKGAIEKQFTGHTAPVTAVVASVNGQILISGGGEGAIRVWNQAMGKEADSILGHVGAVTSLSLNPQDNVLVSAGEDGRIKAWQLPLVSPKGMVHPDQATCLAVSADGAKVVTGGADKVARLWVLATGAKERDFPGPTLAITAVAMSGDGKIAAGSADKTVTIWNAADAKALHKITVPAVVQAVAFSPDSKTVAVGLADNNIKLFNVGDGKEAKTLTGHKGPISALAFSPKGEVLYSASGDKTVQSWGLPDGAAKKKIDLVNPAVHMALSKDGTRLAILEAQALIIFDTTKDGAPLAVALGAQAKCVAFAPDNSRLAVGGADKMARVFDSSGQFLESFAHEGPLNGVAFLDAKKVVTASADKLARVWTSALVWQKAHAGPVRRAVVTAANQVISAGDDKVVKIWKLPDGGEVRTLAAHEGPIVGFSLSADATKLATASADKTAKIWNLAAKAGAPDENKPAATIALAAPAQAVALSPNGLRLAVALEDQKANLVRVYDAASNREIQVLTDHGGPIKSLTFLADNRTLLSAALDKQTRLLDVGVLNAFEAHPGGVITAQINNQGTQLLTAGADKTVKLWDLTKNAVIKTFGPLPEPITAATYNRDFTQVGAASGKAVRVWTIADGKELPPINHPAEVLSLSFSVDKTKIVTGAADKLARIFDLATGKELQFYSQEEAVKAVAFLPANNAAVVAGGKTPKVETLANLRVIVADNGPTNALAVIPANTHVLTAGADKEVKMWNVANFAMERKFGGAGDAVSAIAVAKNAQFIAAAGGKDQAIRIYNFADAKELGNVKTAAPVKALAFTPNSLALAASCLDKNILAWSTVYTAGQPMQPDFLKSIQNFTAADVAQDLVFAADNAAFFTGGLNKALHQWKLASAIPTKTFAHPNHVDAVAFQPNGPLFATGAHDGKIRIFDYVKGLVKEINAHAVANQTMIYQIVFTPDGKQILSASYDNSMKLFDVASGNLVREFKAFKVKDFEKGHQESVFSAAFSPDGKFIASGSGGLERVIKIWDVSNGTVVRDLANPSIKVPPGQGVSSHPGWIYNLRYSKDGKYLISAGDAPGNKGFLGVWNPNDGKLLFGEAMPLGTFFGLAISPADGKMLAIGAGPRGRPTPDFNSAFLLKVPMLGN